LYKLSELTGIDYTFDGIIGMSNIDESSGNLVLNQIWKKRATGSLHNFQFGILLSPE
jgi:hypothetical protein